MKLPVKCGTLCIAAVLAVSTVGCNPRGIQQQSKGHPHTLAAGDGKGTGNVTVLNEDQTANVPIVKIENVSYVSGDGIAKILQLNTKWEANRLTYQIGDLDAAYELKAGSTEAIVDEETISLAQAPLLYQSLFYIPVSALEPLFSAYMSFETKENEVKIYPNLDIAVGSINDPEEPNTGGEYDFVDDPEDPFKGEEPAAEEGEDIVETMASVVYGDGNGITNATTLAATGESLSVPAATLKNIDINQLISKAKRYMGVKYLFGAPPYPQSNKFDCSTFTRYIYGRYGIPLGRTARAQSTKGATVSRNQLRKGDLMFFYVPGRFRTNKTVGHVGIYMGNSRMIHSSPEPANGVQITNINKPYWKKTFLKARRNVY
ncbi:C40 family peptidase [Paenibacillus agricola]|uniref:Peptidoglycan endopeptidase n=1 Tax=Paenibacillus agricola TaxID=2716264 RepID=A0ABX0JD37_9BACL|nr:C40 family peptidase [Paenibacillus agricola]NHN31605.1 peptidoglycan endopeptidase [Paenibacillus agricola]